MPVPCLPTDKARPPRAPRSPWRTAALLCAAALAGLAGLAALLPSVAPAARAEAPSFSAYREASLARLHAARTGPDGAQAAALNAPREWRPASLRDGARAEKGVLLVHGLGDSPFSFDDVGAALAARGFLVRAVLLPGHGTHPDDMLDVTLEDWRSVVREQAGLLERDASDVYLGGFSTGANLVTEYAYEDPRVDGLILFSPAFRSSTALDWTTPMIGWFRPWLIRPEAGRPLQNAVRYLMVPTNGFAQFYRSSRAVRRLLAARPYDKPVFMVVAQHDSVLDADYLLETFQNRFRHPASRLVWYGEAPPQLNDQARVLVRPDRLPRLRISQFSHMGILFSPSNQLYGEAGSLRICANGSDGTAVQACEAGAPVWFSDWGYVEPDKVHARLTFNPYYDWQDEVMSSVLGAASGTPHAAAAAR